MTDISPAARQVLDRLNRTLPKAAFRPLGPAYLEEPRGAYIGHACAVVAPDTVEGVAEVVRAAADLSVPVVPYGGGTGLVGGQVMADGPAPLLLSLERMTAIRSLDVPSGVLVAEAGAILQDVQDAARDAGLLFPLSLAAQGSCRIGGNLATNAGGVNVLRYGNARDLCLGLEAVLPDGSIWHGLSALRKDNTGYDLRNLLIGSEGTLGVITAASLRLFPKPRAEATAIFVVPDPQAALNLLALTRAEVGEAISAFELMSQQGLEFLAETMPQVRQPFDAPPAWSVLVELGFTGPGDPEEALATIFEAAFERDLVSDGRIALSDGQRAEFWTLRESIPEANKKIGAISSHDVSVPLAALPDFIARGDEVIAALGPFRVNCFGHLGDGNLHYNVFPPMGEARETYKDRKGAIMRAVHDLVHEFDGSVSAEHGIGRLKVDDLQRYGDPARLAALRAIKRALDPRGIMNPGAVLAAE
ncbi:FAD-binding oxidoreductase [Fluviibacterium sp. S390]|uniref:FAD-binding oxidoreductase n=1 Tax=Fluviibacterium sp. S390 TaxID=3415139 RepID=UPI003C7C986F